MASNDNTAKINADILSEDIELEHIAGSWEKIVEWSGEMFWNLEALYQAGLVLGAFILGGILYKLLCIRLTPLIDKADLPAKVKSLLTNTRKLLFPIISLLILMIGNMVAHVEYFGLNTPLSEGVVKVIMAWILIRFFAQFIGNSAVRNIFATTIWIVAALSIFGVLGQAITTLDSFGVDIGESRISALIVLKSLFLLFVLLYVAIFASSFLERRILQVKSLSRTSQVLIAKVVRVTLIVVALLIGVTSAGIDLSLFAVFGGAVGLGIGFGLQKGISNLFSGMLLLIDRSIKPGDVIEIPDIGTFGWVNNMAARYTEIVTRDNKSFLIPNEDFITQRVINWSHGNSLVRIHLSFGVHYKSDPAKVVEVVIEAAKAPERVVETPAPVCWITGFGDSSVDFDLRFWIKDAENGVANVRGEVFLAVWQAFKEHDIEIPYPHREVYMHEAKD